MSNEYAYFYNSNNGDRVYDADSFSTWLRKFFTTGVFNGDLFVEEDSGMAIKVGTGYANVEGKVRFFDTSTSFTVPAANSTYPRIDSVMVERNDTDRNIIMKYVQGSYSGNNPVATEPVRESGTYQIVLAQIYIGAGVTEITQSVITDTRPDSDLCGWVTGTVDSVNVEQLTAQAQEQFDVWFDHMKDQLDTDAAGHLQNEIDNLELDINDLESDLASIKATGTTNATGATITSGTYFYLNGALVKAKVDIASGETFTANTNYVVVTAGALNELNGRLIDSDSSADALSNFTATVALVGDIKVIRFGAPSSAMTQGTEYNCGQLPQKYRPKYGSINGEMFGNARTYYVSIDDYGNVGIMTNSSLPSSGIPIIRSTFVYI